jgi:hypothetical protein
VDSLLGEGREQPRGSLRGGFVDATALLLLALLVPLVLALFSCLLLMLC